jgi:hypothetical protein
MVAIVIIDFLAQCFVGFTLMTASLLRLSFRVSRAAKTWASDDFYWNLILIVLALTCFALWIPWVGQFRYLLDGRDGTVVSGQTYLRIAAIAALVIAGIVLQAMKKGSKILFGLAEIAIAFVSNYAVITKLDFSSFPPKIPSAEMIAIVVFTFVLAKGIGTTIEGMEAKREKGVSGAQV